MKKLAVLIALMGAALGVVFAANYEADTLGGADQSYNGRVLVEYFSYDAAGTGHTNDTIYLSLLPANARIIGGELSLSASGSGDTFDMGLAGADGSGYIDIANSDADDVDQLIDGASCAAATKYAFATYAPNGDGLSAVAVQTTDVITEVSTPTYTTNTIVSEVGSAADNTDLQTNTLVTCAIANVYTTNSVATNVSTTAETVYVHNTEAGIEIEKPCYLTMTVPTTVTWATNFTVYGTIYYIEP